MGTKITFKDLSGKSIQNNTSIRRKLKKEGKIAYSEKELKKMLNSPDVSFIHLSKRNVSAVNKLHYKKHGFLLLEGNPVTYYFSIAYDLLPQIDEARLQLVNSLTSLQNGDGLKTSNVFSYVFKTASVAIIFSFLALEAFMNQCLPDYGEIEYEGKKVSKDIIQKFASFENKLRNIIPKTTIKDFALEHPKKVEILLKLRKLRNALIHLKENRNNHIAAYDEVYNEILNVDLQKIIRTVKFYINYHTPKTIQNYNIIRRKKARVLHQEQGEDATGKYVKYYYSDDS